MASEKKTFYFEYVHPAAGWFWHNVLNTPKRAFFSMFIAFVLTLVSQIYPICTEKMCYTIFAQLLFMPSLLFKPFAFGLILSPALFIFMILTLVWFGIFSLFSMLQKTGFVHELLFPILSTLFFVYMAFLVSGTMGQLFLHTGLVECINSEDCIRAGYVGEVCTSVYRPVYTQYSPDLMPLTSCGCAENKCIGR